MDLELLGLAADGEICGLLILLKNIPVVLGPGLELLVREKLWISDTCPGWNFFHLPMTNTITRPQKYSARSGLILLRTVQHSNLDKLGARLNADAELHPRELEPGRIKILLLLNLIEELGDLQSNSLSL